MDGCLDGRYGSALGILLLRSHAVCVLLADQLLLATRWKVHSRAISLWDECYDVAE